MAKIRLFIHMTAFFLAWHRKMQSMLLYDNNIQNANTRHSRKPTAIKAGYFPPFFRRNAPFSYRFGVPTNFGRNSRTAGAAKPSPIAHPTQRRVAGKDDAKVMQRWCKGGACRKAGISTWKPYCCSCFPHIGPQWPKNRHFEFFLAVKILLCIFAGGKGMHIPM